MKKIIAILSVFLLIPIPCYAYIDPGSGSLILQVIIAGIVSGIFAIKLFWRRLVLGFQRFLGKTPISESEPKPIHDSAHLNSIKDITDK